MRSMLAGAVSVLLLAGCGSGSTDDGSSTPPPASAPSSSDPGSATYFAGADTTAINEKAGAAQQAAAAALDRKATTRCDQVGTQRGYRAWRRCWHALLDPVGAAMGELSQQMTTLSAHPFPSACRTALTRAAASFTSFATRLRPLTRGIDSRARPAQVRAMRTYDRTLSAVLTDFHRPFAPLTQVCYSPGDLASINASPSPSG